MDVFRHCELPILYLKIPPATQYLTANPFHPLIYLVKISPKHSSPISLPAYQVWELSKPVISTPLRTELNKILSSRGYNIIHRKLTTADHEITTRYIDILQPLPVYVAPCANARDLPLERATPSPNGLVKNCHEVATSAPLYIDGTFVEINIHVTFANEPCSNILNCTERRRSFVKESGGSRCTSRRGSAATRSTLQPTPIKLTPVSSSIETLSGLSRISARKRSVESRTCTTQSSILSASKAPRLRSRRLLSLALVVYFHSSCAPKFAGDSEDRFSPLYPNARSEQTGETRDCRHRWISVSPPDGTYVPPTLETGVPHPDQTF